MPTASTAIVTGASAGLGAVFAHRLAARGHRVVLVARREDRLATLANEIRDAHRTDVTVFAADLTDRGARLALLDALPEHGDEVGVLVNNAGFGASGAFHTMPEARNLGQVALNVEALTHLCQLLAPRMVTRGRGHIVNIASTAAFQPGPGMAVYCATKAYVLSFSEALAEELAPHGVKVTAHCPGPTRTEFAQVARDGKPLPLASQSASAEDVVDDALRAMDAGRVVKVHGATNTLMAMMPRFLPRAWVRKAAGRVIAAD